jgi:hypothetical protein
MLTAALALFGIQTAEAHTATAARSGGPREPCPTVPDCRSQLAHAQRAIQWQRDARRGLEQRLRRRWAPSSAYAIRLASLVYDVDPWAMLRVARCESGLDATATNGQYAGLFQTGPGFWSSTPFASFSRFDPLANALAAASVVRVQGWRQWQCQP